MHCSPSLTELIRRVAMGESLPERYSVSPGAHAVTTVLAAAGYPDKPRTGDRIEIPRAPDHVLVFHAGTKRAANGDLVTAVGRVLGRHRLRQTFEEAQLRSLGFANSVTFAGKQHRSDIGGASWSG
jgi:phosphoribosylamine-glycine ligase